MSKIFVFSLVLLARCSLADPSSLPSLRVAVEVPGQDQLRFGTLTLAVDGVKFDSEELLFRVPIQDLEDLKVAGFRERFLTLVVRKDSEFVQAYGFLFSDRRYPSSSSLSLSFQLGPKEVLRAAVETGNTYRSQIADRLRTHPVSAAGPLPPATAASVSTPRPPLPPAAPIHSSAAVGGVSDTAGAKVPPAVRELFRLNVRYVEKRKGMSSLVLTGLPGELLFFEDSLGFRSQVQNPRLGPDKVPFLQDGYLKFRIADKDIENVTYQALSGHYTALVLTIQRQSSFYVESKALLTDTRNDNEIVFLVPDGANRSQLSSYFRQRVHTGF